MSAETKEMIKQENQDLQKQEHQEEKTIAGRYFMPQTDIVETENNLLVTMDMPGVKKENVEVKLDNNVLEVEGKIDFSPYKDMTPVYSEYNVGHYTRRFSVSNTIDAEKIEANLAEGVLTLTLPKAPEAQARQIPVS
ncbi:MAG: Hsp20/alpha crystallin family protein [SAR324 cluster bacterium]|nr:Hsp20/alpha crystallin family protein [SAR324 cluster bacterium]